MSISVKKAGYYWILDRETGKKFYAHLNPSKSLPGSIVGHIYKHIDIIRMEHHPEYELLREAYNES